jgi:hypothetical protein
MSTKFFAKEEGNSLLNKFKGAFEHFAGMHAFHAFVGYFRASGYFTIREHLLKVPEVKLLMELMMTRLVLMLKEPLISQPTEKEFIFHTSCK